MTAAIGNRGRRRLAVSFAAIAASVAAIALLGAGLLRQFEERQRSISQIAQQLEKERWDLDRPLIPRLLLENPSRIERLYAPKPGSTAYLSPHSSLSDEEIRRRLKTIEPGDMFFVVPAPTERPVVSPAAAEKLFRLMRRAPTR